MRINFLAKRALCLYVAFGCEKRKKKKKVEPNKVEVVMYLFGYILLFEKFEVFPTKAIDPLTINFYLEYIKYREEKHKFMLILGMYMDLVVKS